MCARTYFPVLRLRRSPTIHSASNYSSVVLLVYTVVDLLHPAARATRPCQAQYYYCQRPYTCQTLLGGVRHCIALCKKVNTRQQLLYGMCRATSCQVYRSRYPDLREVCYKPKTPLLTINSLLSYPQWKIRSFCAGGSSRSGLS